MGDVVVFVIVNLVVVAVAIGGIALQWWAVKRGAERAAENGVDKARVFRTRVIGLTIVSVVAVTGFLLLRPPG